MNPCYFNNKVLMNKELTLNLTFFFSVFAFIVGHGIYLNTPWVNLEYAFGEAARGILNPYYTTGFEKYWEVEANPLGYSLITASIASFLGISFWSIRIPSLLGGIAILVAGWLFYRSKDFKNNALFFLWTAIISITPLVWIYSGRATADVLPVGLVVLAFLFCYYAEERLWIHLIAGLCFSLASLVKLHSILLGVGFVYILFTDQEGKINWSRRRGLKFLFYSLLPAVILGIYFLVIYSQFGIVFIPEQHKEALVEGYAKNFVSAFLMYNSLLGTMFATFCFLSITHLQKIWSKRNILILMIIILIAGSVFWRTLSSFPAGEMGFSNLYDTLLNQKVISLIRIGGFILAFFLFIELINTAFREESKTALFFLCSILPFLVILSFFKPCQRYLLFCLPFLSFYLVVILGSRMPRLTHWMGWPSIAVFIAINVFSIFHQIGQGRASENMAQWVISNGYLNNTEPGAILPHAGHHFLQNQEGQKKYIINIGKTPPGNFLHEESVFVFGKKIKTYYLIENEQDSR